MIINFQNLTPYNKLPKIFLKNLEILLNLIQKNINKKDKKIVSVIFVNDKYMQSLCKKYYPKKLTTDILSFPSDSNNEKELGDLIFNIDIILKTYKNYYENLENEIYFLFVHGYLHLSGYDHSGANDTLLMKNLENLIMNEFLNIK